MHNYDISFYETKPKFIDKNKLNFTYYYSTNKTENVIDEHQNTITFEELSKVL